MKPVYLWGAGGAALWVLELLADINAKEDCAYEVIGLVADEVQPQYPSLKKYPFIGRKQDGWKKKINRDALAVITPGTPATRELFYREISEIGLALPVLIHPTAVVSKQAVIKSGCLVGAQTIVASEAVLEENCLINYQCAIGHASKIGRHSVLSSATQVGGDVICGEQLFTGMNAVLLPRIQIGSGVEISAGALATHSLESKMKLMASLPRKIQFN